MAQATSRPCDPDGIKDEHPGPACLLSHERLGGIVSDTVYWSLDTYSSIEAARQDKDSRAGEEGKTGNGSVIRAFGKIWLFTIGPLASHPHNGEHVADVGPIPVNGNTSYDAEFLKSTFSPGMSAPIHVHSGPEAFYAVSGVTCLETPDGLQVGRNAGNTIVVRGGPPMLLMALGREERKGFALILHDATLPPTTLVHNWTPKGLCQAETE
jgi:quercetin dioxygenase-like cupin family protein